MRPCRKATAEPPANSRQLENPVRAEVFFFNGLRLTGAARPCEFPSRFSFLKRTAEYLESAPTMSRTFQASSPDTGGRSPSIGYPAVAHGPAGGIRKAGPAPDRMRDSPRSLTTARRSGAAVVGGRFRACSASPLGRRAPAWDAPDILTDRPAEPVERSFRRGRSRTASAA